MTSVCSEFADRPHPGRKSQDIAKERHAPRRRRDVPFCVRGSKLSCPEEFLFGWLRSCHAFTCNSQRPRAMHVSYSGVTSALASHAHGTCDSRLTTVSGGTLSFHE